jgi:hypothetical protein
MWMKINLAVYRTCKSLINNRINKMSNIINNKISSCKTLYKNFNQVTKN